MFKNKSYVNAKENDFFISRKYNFGSAAYMYSYSDKYSARKFVLRNIKNMAAVRNFEVMSNSFHLKRISPDLKYYNKHIPFWCVY